jgi:hypothetical protein
MFVEYRPEFKEHKARLKANRARAQAVDMRLRKERTTVTDRYTRVDRMDTSARARLYGNLKKPHKEELSQCDVCAVTGIPLRWDLVWSPYSPSLDRIDNNGGYNVGNVRVVCVMANYAMNTFGADALLQFIADASKLAAARESALVRN